MWTSAGHGIAERLATFTPSLPFQKLLHIGTPPTVKRPVGSCYRDFPKKHRVVVTVRGVRPRAPRGYRGRQGRLPPTNRTSNVNPSAGHGIAERHPSTPLSMTMGTEGPKSGLPPCRLVTTSKTPARYQHPCQFRRRSCRPRKSSPFAPSAARDCSRWRWDAPIRPCCRIRNTCRVHRYR